MSTTSMSGEETSSSQEPNTFGIPNREATVSAVLEVLFQIPATRKPAAA